MASSPEKSRRRGHHSRSIALTASTSSTSSLMPGPATTKIAGGSAQAKNPLLQQDITPSDLFSQYTPAQISQHLSALKSQLQTYDAELRALINNRYEDILSVGNTISAMERSSANLSQALRSASRGMKGGDGESGSVKAQVSDHMSKEEEQRIQAQKRVKYIAALLLVLQEAPDEIWRLLDVSVQYKSTASHPADAETLLSQTKAKLKSARRLSLATSLLVLLKHAGDQLQSLGQDVISLFPHPLSNHATVVGTIETEIKNSLTDLVGSSSVALAASGIEGKSTVERAFQPCLEATFRTCILALTSLRQLGVIASVTDASQFFLARRQQTLENWMQEQCKLSGQNLGHTLQSCYQEIAEVCILHQQIFASGDGHSKNVLEQVLDAFSEAEGGSAPSAKLSIRLASLVPPTSLTAAANLPSAEQVTPVLQDEDSGLAIALRAFADSLVQSESQSSDITAYQSAVSTHLTTKWTPTLLKSSHKNSEIGRARNQLHKSHLTSTKLAHRILSNPTQSSIDFLQTLCTTTKRLLDQRATHNFSIQIDQWRLDAVGALQDAQRKGGHNDVLEQLFLSSSGDARRQRSTRTSSVVTQLRDTMQGRSATSPLTAFLDSIVHGWDELQAAKGKYLAYLAHDESERISLTQEWREKERTSAWEALFIEIRGMLKTASLVSSDEHHDRVLLLANALRLLLTVPRYADLIRASATTKQFDEMRNSVLVARKEALQSWRTHVVQHAESLWTGEGPKDDTVNPRLLQALAYINEQSYEAVGVGLRGHADTDAEMQNLLDVGSFVDLLEGLVEHASEVPISDDLDVIVYILRASGSSALSTLDNRRPRRLDDSSIAANLQPYRLFLGQCPRVVVPVKQQSLREDNALPSLPTTTPVAVKPLFELAGTSRRLRGVQVR